MLRSVFAALGLTAALLSAGSPPVGAADLLANGGFEQGVDGWRVNSGSIEAVAAPVHEGSHAGRFSGSSQATTQFAFQNVQVQPHQKYTFSGWVGASGTIYRVFLRISWLDANGQGVVHDDSLDLPWADGTYYPLTTGPKTSPSAARSAWVRLVVMGEPGSQFAVHLDDFQLAGPVATIPSPGPPPTPTPAVPQPPTPAPPQPTASPRPPATPRATKTPSPPSNLPPVIPVQESEPLVWPELFNGSFEQSRNDGTPLGWRKQGGEINAGAVASDGERSLALTSHTGSTKWAYQTVAVTGGAYYRGTVDVSAGQGTEAAFLRLSWYASDDGSGSALSSVDSTDSVATVAGAFRRLTTETVQAPVGAATVKFRLMMRPLSAEPAVAYFDSASFAPTDPSPEEAVLANGRGEQADDPALAVSESLPGSEESSDITSDRPKRLANVRPETEGGRPNASPAGRTGEDWAIALALAIALSAIATAGGYELWQRRIASRGDAGSRADKLED